MNKDYLSSGNMFVNTRSRVHTPTLGLSSNLSKAKPKASKSDEPDLDEKSSITEIMKLNTSKKEKEKEKENLDIMNHGDTENIEENIEKMEKILNMVDSKKLRGFHDENTSLFFFFSYAACFFLCNFLDWMLMKIFLILNILEEKFGKIIKILRSQITVMNEMKKDHFFIYLMMFLALIGSTIVYAVVYILFKTVEKCKQPVARDWIKKFELFY